MDEVAVSDLRKLISEYVNRVVYGGETIILTRHGKRIAKLVPCKEDSAVKGWEKMRRRGALIEEQNRERLRNLTLEQAISDLESLLCEPPVGDFSSSGEAPLPVSLARLIDRRKGRGKEE